MKEIYLKSNLSLFVADLKTVVQLELVSVTDLEGYKANTIETQQVISGAIKCQTQEQVQKIVKLANQYKVQLYPISTGNNWGYGSANPVSKDSIILDLSALNRIIEINKELGYIRLEPGVTQQQLSDELEKRKLDFFVPTTGAGPSCSVLANALERGYGITPESDHFLALTSLKSVLADGEVYQSNLSALGLPKLDAIFKWGIGPYLDGIFTQSNVGVVLEASINLEEKPDCIEPFFVRLTEFDGVIDVVKKILSDLGANLGGFNLMNDLRMLSMMSPYPKDVDLLSLDQISDLSSAYKIPKWTGMGTIIGTKSVVRACRKEIKKRLKPLGCQVLFLTPTTSRVLELAGKIAPAKLSTLIKANLTKLNEVKKILNGVPSEAALPLSYWRSNIEIDQNKPINPARDNCGLIWYSPLIPMQSGEVEKYISFVESTCRRYKIEPLITLTSLSWRVFDSTVPILFDKSNREQAKNAKACYQALLTEGKKLGFFPYRVSIDHMNVSYPEATNSESLQDRVKRALDPNLIMSPKRYSRI
jgi:4-cresol dehydrogenase (hydroxylating) flavoprotein subunit